MTGLDGRWRRLLSTVSIAACAVATAEAGTPVKSANGDDMIVAADRAGAEIEDDGGQVLRTTRFLEPFYVCAIRGKRHLVSTMKAGCATTEGWVRGEHLIDDGGSAAQVDGVFRKAVLHNEPDGKNVREWFHFVDGPRASASASHRESALFKVWFVYKEVDGFLLLGNSPTITNPHEPGRFVVGWIPKTSTWAWNSREAVEVVRADSGTVRFYKDTRQLFKELSGSPVQASKVLGWVEDRSESWSPTSHRFPVLMARNLNAQRYLMVGLVVNGYETKNGQVVRLLSKRELEQRQAVYRDMRNELSNLDVVFVVDGTGSMAAAAETVHAAAAGVIEQICAGEAPCRARAATVIYRDIEQACTPLEATPLTDPTGALAKILPASAGGTTIYGCGHDDPAVFSGLAAAGKILLEQGRPGSWRVVLHMGDMLAHDRDKNGNTAATAQASLRAAKVETWRGWQLAPSPHRSQ